MTECRLCRAPLAPFMSFGRMPIANGFLTRAQIADEYFFELAPAFCETCGMFQLMEQPAPERMFHDAYAFFSSTSRGMQTHFARFAETVIAGPLAGAADPFVVELGSNDGIMLRHFRARGIRHLGVEPSSNVADVARGQGIETISAFFNADLADRIVREQEAADAVLAANVMCHIPDLHSVAAGIKRLLKPTGVLMFEDPYLGDMIAKTSYDQIYDEHVFIFSAHAVGNAFARHGLDLIDVQPQTTHGGSMRYVLAPAGHRPVSAAVAALLNAERAQGLDRPEAFVRFKKACEASRDGLTALLRDLRAKGKRVVGYGATSKSTTVLNYCGLSSAEIEFISDTTPIKQGKLTPGSHIPVRPHAAFAEDHPDYAVLFAWNHGAEIREKETAFTRSGGKWVLFVPRVEVA